MLMHHYVNFRSPCRIQTPSRPVSYTGGKVQQIAKQEILTVVASVAVHCCAIKKLLLHHSHTMLPVYSSQ